MLTNHRQGTYYFNRSLLIIQHYPLGHWNGQKHSQHYKLRHNEADYFFHISNNNSVHFIMQINHARKKYTSIKLNLFSTLTREEKQNREKCI